MMLSGTNTTLMVVSLEIRLFWLMLMKPTVASIRKLILPNRKEVWPSSESMSRRIWRTSSCWSVDKSRLRIRKDSARRVSSTLRRMRPLRSSSLAMSERISAASSSVTCGVSTVRLTFSSSA